MPSERPAIQSLASQQGVPSSVFADLRPCFLGLCLVIASSTSLSLLGGSYQMASILPVTSYLPSFVRLVAFLTVAIASGSLADGLSRPRPRLAVAAVSVVGMAMILVARMVVPAGTLPMVLFICGTVAFNAGYAMLYLMWIDIYAKMDLPHVLVCFTLVHLCSALVSTVLALISAEWFVAGVLMLMPVASVILLGMAHKRSERAPFMQGERAVSGWSFPLRPIVLLATFTFANSFVRSFLTIEMNGVALAGVIVAACLVLAVMGRVLDHGLRPLYSLSLPLVIAGSLCVLVALPGFDVAGGILTNAAYTLFSIFATALLCSISYRSGVNALWLFGFAQAAITFGSLAARVASAQAGFVAQDSVALTLAMGGVILLFICLYVLFDTSSERADAWGVTLPSGESVQAQAPVRLEDSCSRLARQYGLTLREEEVMLLLVKGEPFARIEESLCVSNSTLKTHARHIYAKTGVSGRGELAELAGASGAGRG